MAECDRCLRLARAEEARTKHKPGLGDEEFNLWVKAEHEWAELKRELLALLAREEQGE